MAVLSSDTHADVADAHRVQETLRQVQPEVVFHLATQPLVRESYRNPAGTLLGNVMGTAHVLEATRATRSVRTIVLVTTDKVYENREWVYPYREVDRLNGLYPYSASKVRLRFPDAVRRWQHVLEPLSGYLKLAECLLRPDSSRFARAWNFGPDASGEATVADVAKLRRDSGDKARAWNAPLPQTTRTKLVF